MTLGFAFVCLTYVVVGVFGYFGFVGSYFTSYYINNNTEAIAQNCFTMFSTTNVLAFFVRLAFFAFLFCVFPLINHFIRSLTF